MSIMNYSRECMYDVEWQKLRCRMLGKWQSEPGVKQCLSMIDHYWSRAEEGKAERVWRCLNLLNAVKLGWAQGHGAPTDIALALVGEASTCLSRVYGNLGHEMASDWNWGKVRTDLMTLDRFVLHSIRTDLVRRAASAKRRFDGDEDKVRLHRPELVFFLELLDIEEMRRDGKPIKCLCKVVEKYSPYMQEFRGFRILSTTPNLAGTKPFTDERCPSFDKPYLLVIFGDYETDEALQKALPKVAGEMKRRGFEQIEWLEKA